MKIVLMELSRVFLKGIMELYLHMDKQELEKPSLCKDYQMMKEGELFLEHLNTFSTIYMELKMLNFLCLVVCQNYIMNRYLIYCKIMKTNQIFMRDLMRDFM